MTTVKVTDSKEKKQAWLDYLVESDPWMAKNLYLPQIIQMGKTQDPEMAELALSMLNKIKNQEE